MKQGLFILSLLILASCSCSTAVTGDDAPLLGVWTWENVDVISSTPVLKKHVLTLEEGMYQEAFFEHSMPKGQQEGTLLASRDGDEVEFSTIGNVGTVYKGVLSGNQLMIKSINDKVMNPPALYIRS